MKPTIIGHEAVNHDDLLVHSWRVAQLTRLGIPRSLAEAYADHLDWHQIARLYSAAARRAWPSASSADEHTRRGL